MRVPGRVPGGGGSLRLPRRGRVAEAGAARQLVPDSGSRFRCAGCAASEPDSALAVLRRRADPPVYPVPAHLVPGDGAPVLRVFLVDNRPRVHPGADLGDVVPDGLADRLPEQLQGRAVHPESLEALFRVVFTFRDFFGAQGSLLPGQSAKFQGQVYESHSQPSRGINLSISVPDYSARFPFLVPELLYVHLYSAPHLGDHQAASGKNILSEDKLVGDGLNCFIFFIQVIQLFTGLPCFLDYFGIAVCGALIEPKVFGRSEARGQVADRQASGRVRSIVLPFRRALLGESEL